MSRVYLAGPITGLSYGDSTDWRHEVSRQLALFGIVGISPLRAKDYLAEEQKIAHSYDNAHDLHPLATVLSGARGITTRDRWDCHRCDVVFLNLLGATKVSIGTMMELAWADASRIPTVVAIEPEGNPHDHPMVNECTGFRVSSIEDALSVIRALLVEV